MKISMLRLGISVTKWLGIALLALQLSPITTRAAAPLAYPFRLEWNGSSDPTVMGYVVYYGVQGASLTNRVDVGANVSLALMNLQASSNYFFYVVSYDSSGVESSPSQVFYYAPPAFSPLVASLFQNSAVVVQFQAATNASCRVEFTPTLSPAQWQLLSSVRADSNGDVTVTDAPPAEVTARFYRAVEP